jgi:site-specific recombinase XerD
MIEDMIARGLGPATQRNHIRAGKLFAAYIKRSPETAAPDDVRLFQMSLIERGLSIQNRNRIMTGLRFLLRVTMRRHDLAAEIYHMKEPQKIPQILSADEASGPLIRGHRKGLRALWRVGMLHRNAPCGRMSLGFTHLLNSMY